MPVEQNFAREHVDLESVINEQKLLTRKEFELKFPNSNYDDYFKEFYRRKTKEFYKKNCDYRSFTGIFHCNFLHKDKILERYHSFCQKKENDFPILDYKTIFTRRFNNIDKKYIILERIPSSYSENDIRELLRPFKEIKKLDFAEVSYSTAFGREATITLFPDSDPIKCKEAVEELCTEGISVNTFILSDEILVRRALIHRRSRDIINLRDTICMLNKYYKTNIVYDCDNVDKLITFLRHVFLYCYYCTHVFDTEIEVIRKCGDYHVRDGRVQRRVFNFEQNIMTPKKGFSYTKPDSPETRFDEYVVKLADGMFECDLCHKTFEQLVYVKEHIKDKHEELCSEIEEELERFSLNSK